PCPTPSPLSSPCRLPQEWLISRGSVANPNSYAIPLGMVLSLTPRHCTYQLKSLLFREIIGDRSGHDIARRRPCGRRGGRGDGIHRGWFRGVGRTILAPMQRIPRDL